VMKMIEEKTVPSKADLESKLFGAFPELAAPPGEK